MSDSTRACVVKKYHSSGQETAPVQVYTLIPHRAGLTWGVNRSRRPQRTLRGLHGSKFEVIGTCKVRGASSQETMQFEAVVSESAPRCAFAGPCLRRQIVSFLISKT